MKRGWGVWVGMAALSVAAAPSPEVPALGKTTIQSRRVRVLNKGQSVEFTGDVTMVRGKDFLSADRLVTNETTSVANAWGNVYLRRTGIEGSGPWEAWGDEGVYDTQRASGTLWGVGRLARAKRQAAPLTPEGSFHIEAARLTFFETSNQVVPSTAVPTAHAEGWVYVHTEEESPVLRQTQAWSDQADFSGTPARIVLRGGHEKRGAPPPGSMASPLGNRPFARQVEGRQTRKVEGDTIEYDVSDKRLIVKNRVKASLWLARSTTSTPSPSGDSRGPSR